MIIHLPDRTSGAPDLAHAVPRLHGGGTAANTAVALARLGVAAALVGAVGDDGYGRWVYDDLVHEGVDVQGLSVVSDGFTPMVMALIEPGGERMVVVWPSEGGAHQLLEADAIDPGWISSAAWLHTTGMCLRAAPSCDAILYAMEQGREAGVPVSLDLNLRKECWGLQDVTQRRFERAIELSDVVFGNAEEEIIPIAGVASVEAAAERICAGRRMVIARLGKQGALVVTPKETLHAPAFQAKVVDTLGAGDAFNGGFIAARLANVDVGEAARWGNAAAAFKIGKSGARSLPMMDELKQILG
jgi:fructokinase/2-dehydro-3-deoxygluconokinase